MYLNGVIAALVYASFGVAPLVYSYIAARRNRRVYDAKVAEVAVETPTVPVQVIVVVKDEGSEAKVVKGGYTLEQVRMMFEDTLPLHREEEEVDIFSLGPVLEGVKAPKAITLTEAVGEEGL